MSMAVTSVNQDQVPVTLAVSDRSIWVFTFLHTAAGPQIVDSRVTPLDALDHLSSAPLRGPLFSRHLRVVLHFRDGSTHVFDGPLTEVQRFLGMLQQYLAKRRAPAVPNLAPGPGAEASASGSHATARPRSAGNERSLEASLAALDSLVGLDHVKREVRQLKNLMEIQRKRLEQNLPAGHMTHHLAFVGNPGTGKTTVARLIGQLYRALGVVPRGHLVEAARRDLVAEYLGQTATKTAAVFETAIGGVLFVDEAYSLTDSGPGEPDPYGREAVDTLLKLMEDRRDDTVVIIAGYPEKIARFLMSNPGLRSRFGTVIRFDDYSDEELLAVFLHFCEEEQLICAPDARARVVEYFATRQRDETFGNAREARLLFEQAKLKQGDRLAPEGDSVGRDALQTLTAADIASPA